MTTQLPNQLSDKHLKMSLKAFGLDYLGRIDNVETKQKEEKSMTLFQELDNFEAPLSYYLEQGLIFPQELEDQEESLNTKVHYKDFLDKPAKDYFTALNSKEV